MILLQPSDVFTLTGGCSEGIDAFGNVLGHASDAGARCTGLALGAVSHLFTRCGKSTAPPSSPRQGGGLHQMFAVQAIPCDAVGCFRGGKNINVPCFVDHASRRVCFCVL